MKPTFPFIDIFKTGVSFKIFSTVVTAAILNCATFAQDKEYSDVQEKPDSQYIEIIKRAEKAMSSGNHILATRYFTQALELNPDDPEVKGQLKHIANFKAARRINMEYANLIARADLLYSAQSYDSATFYYSAAFKLQPNEHYPLVRVSEIAREVKEIKTADSIQEVVEEGAMNRELSEGKLSLKEKELSTEQNEGPPEGGQITNKESEVQTILSEAALQQEILIERSAEALVEIQIIESKSVVLQDEMERETEKLTFNEMQNNVAKAKSKKTFLEEIAESKRRIRLEKDK